jgi:hypothetical protein
VSVIEMLLHIGYQKEDLNNKIVYCLTQHSVSQWWHVVDHQARSSGVLCVIIHADVTSLADVTSSSLTLALPLSCYLFVSWPQTCASTGFNLTDKRLSPALHGQERPMPGHDLVRFSTLPFFSE